MAFRLDRLSVEMIVHAGPNDIVGDVAAERNGEDRRRPDITESTQIEVEIFDLGSPVVAENRFSTAAQSPACPRIIETVRTDYTYWSGRAQRFSGPYSAIGQATGCIEQPCRGGENTDASAHKSSPLAPFNADTDWTRPDSACGGN